MYNVVELHLPISRWFALLSTCLVTVSFSFIFLAIPAGIFEKPESCFLAPLAVGVTFGLCIFFAVIALGFYMTSLIMKMKDLFGVRTETLLDVIGFFITSAVGLLFNLFVNRVGFQFSSLMYQVAVSAYLFYSVTLIGIIPVVRSFFARHTPTEADLKDLTVWLENDQLRAVFKEYSRSELALENILFYEECLSIKRKNAISQVDADHIISNFLQASSPLEINITSKNKVPVVCSNKYVNTSCSSISIIHRV